MAINNVEIFDLMRQWMETTQKILSLEDPPRDFGTGDLLNRTEVHAIVIIGRTTGVNITSLAEQLKISISAASQVVRKLSTLKFVEKYHRPDNEKEVILRLTPRGKIVYHTHEQFHAKIEELLMRKMGPITREEFEKLKKFIVALDETSDLVLETKK